MRFNDTIVTALGVAAAAAAPAPAGSPTTMVKVARGRYSNVPLAPAFTKRWHPAYGKGVNTIDMNVDADFKVTGDLLVGSHEEPVRLLLDPNSADTWLFTTDYRDPPAHKDDQHKKPEGDHKLYKPDQSTTHRRVEAEDAWADYANGAAVGFKGYRDEFHFGMADIHEDHMILKNVPFGGVYNSEGDIDVQMSGLDGYLGLGMDSKFLNATADQFAQPIFTVEISHDQQYGQPRGHLVLGAIHTDEIEDEIKYAPCGGASSASSWAVSLADLQITTAASEKHLKKILNLSVNFAVPMTNLPLDVVEAFVQAAKGKMHDGVRPLVPCKPENGEFPDIELLFVAPEGRTVPFEIKGRDLLGGPMGGQEGMCDIWLAPGPDHEGVLGFHALKNEYIVFDYGKRRLGFASKKVHVGSY